MGVKACAESPNGVSKIKVRVSKKAPTKKPKLGKMKYFGGRTTKNVDPKDTIKIKPKKGVPGRTVLVYKPGKKTVLSLSDVKVYVRPIKTPEEGETPEGPEEEEPEDEKPEDEEPEEPTEPAETAAPGQPKGPGGPEGPDGPDGPEEGTKPDQPAAGPGTNPAAGNDGNPDTCFKSKKANSPWWSVDLGKTWEVVAVHVKACAESPNGVSKIKVRVSKKAPTKKPKLGKMKYFGGRTTKNVDPKDTIKIKPKKGVPGRTVLVYK